MTNPQQQATEEQAVVAEQEAQVWITASAPTASTLQEALTEIAQRVGRGQSNGIGPAGQSYSFAVEGLVDGLIEPYVALVSLNGDIDATLAFSYDQALTYLRERAQDWDWEMDPEHPLDRTQATVEQLSKLYACDGAGDGQTWVAIVAIAAWFGAGGRRPIV